MASHRPEPSMPAVSVPASTTRISSDKEYVYGGPSPGSAGSPASGSPGSAAACAGSDISATSCPMLDATMSSELRPPSSAIETVPPLRSAMNSEPSHMRLSRCS